MPRLPVSPEPRSLPANIGGGLITPDFGGKSGIAEVGRQVGKVLQIRGGQLAKEYDTVKAISAYNDFSESSRGMIGDLLKRESGAAEGVQDEYKEWFLKNQTNYTDMLNSQPQQQMYQEMANQRRETDLNTLARHEATQYKVQKKEALDRHATDADLKIREAATEALKTPGKNFQKTDEVIEGFNLRLESMFPGHDLKALSARYTQLLRVAQMETMIETDPQTAAEYIEKEEIKDQLSYVDNGTLHDAYPALKSKLKVEKSRDLVDKAYFSLTSKFPLSPEKAVKALYDENVMKELGLGVAERDRLVNTFRAEIAAAEKELKEKEEAIADNERKQINEYMRVGDMKSALDILDRSEHIPVEHYAAIYNVIHTRASDYTDWDKFEKLSRDIEQNVVTKESQLLIHSNRGIGRSEMPILRNQLAEQINNPAIAYFMKEAFEYYDVEFADNTLMLQDYRPILRREIMQKLQDPAQDFKGEDILDYVIEKAGTKDQMYKKYYFFGTESTKAPAGEDIEQLRKRRKSQAERQEKDFENRTGKSAPAPLVSDTISDIPQNILTGIEKYLKDNGFKVNDKNILMIYHKNKGKTTKAKQSSPGLGVSF